MDSTFLSNWEKNVKNICYTKVIWGSHFSACKFSFTDMKPDLVIGCHLWPSCQEGLWTALTEVMWPATTGILRSCDLQHLGIWGHVACNIWNTYCLDLGEKCFLTSVLYQHEKFAWIWLCLSFSSHRNSSTANTCEDVSSFWEMSVYIVQKDRLI